MKLSFLERLFIISMIYLATFFLAGCENENKPIPNSYDDIQNLRECPEYLAKSHGRYATMTADNGDVLYLSKFTEYKCLKRNKK